MKCRFIDIEGLHGCGKTSTAWHLHRNIQANQMKSNAFFEADMDAPYENECDFNFLSVLTQEEMGQVIARFPEQANILKRKANNLEDMHLFYQPDLPSDDASFIKMMTRFGAYSGRFVAQEFVRLMCKRLKSFTQKAMQTDSVLIYESVIFQQIINELLRFSDFTPTEIAKSIVQISDVLAPLDPLLIHLRTQNIKAIIDEIAAQRLSDNYDLYPDWINWMLLYVKHSRYGETHHVQNRSDLIHYFQTRAEIENAAYDLLHIQKASIDIDTMSKEALNALVYRIAIET